MKNDFLRAVGLGNIQTIEDEFELMDHVIKTAGVQRMISLDAVGTLCIYNLKLTTDYGIIVYGTACQDDVRAINYYPYYVSKRIAASEKIVYNKQVGQLTMLGSFDDVHFGGSMIFFVQNFDEIWAKGIKEGVEVEPVNGVTFTGLSINGRVILPLYKTNEQKKREIRLEEQQADMLRKAQGGDEEAIENLIDAEAKVYDAVSNRIARDDLYTLIESYIVPQGVECDIYEVMGTIEGIKEEVNPLSKGVFYVLSVISRGITMLVTISKEDLLGIPKVGRRFKGIVWMQGFVK